VGSGIGSVPERAFLEELPQLVEAVAEHAVVANARPIPLAEVEQAWTEAAERSERIVLVP